MKHASSAQRTSRHVLLPPGRGPMTSPLKREKMTGPEPNNRRPRNRRPRTGPARGSLSRKQRSSVKRPWSRCFRTRWGRDSRSDGRRFRLPSSMSPGRRWRRRTNWWPRSCSGWPKASPGSGRTSSNNGIAARMFRPRTFGSPSSGTDRSSSACSPLDVGRGCCPSVVPHVENHLQVASSLGVLERCVNAGPLDPPGDCLGRVPGRRGLFNPLQPWGRLESRKDLARLVQQPLSVVDSSLRDEPFAVLEECGRHREGDGELSEYPGGGLEELLDLAVRPPLLREAGTYSLRLRI